MLAHALGSVTQTEIIKPPGQHLMNINFSAEDLAFRDRERAIFKSHFTAELAARIASPKTYKDGMIEWQKILAKKGWIAPNWPVEYGGTGWSVAEDYLYERERSAAGAPDVVPFGLKMVAQVIIAYGTDAQKQQFLPRILNSDDWWCQGY